MCHLTLKANECVHKEKDRRFIEQFINSIIDDDDMMTKIIRKLTAIKKEKETKQIKASVNKY